MPNLASFDPSTFRATVEHGRTRCEYPTERLVFSQGDAADSVFYIARGKIKIAVTSAQGREAVVGLFGKGDFFGEGCLIGQPLRLATAVAMTDTTVMRLERAEMIRVLPCGARFCRDVHSPPVDPKQWGPEGPQFVVERRSARIGRLGLRRQFSAMWSKLNSRRFYRVRVWRVGGPGGVPAGSDTRNRRGVILAAKRSPRPPSSADGPAEWRGRRRREPHRPDGFSGVQLRNFWREKATDWRLLTGTEAAAVISQPRPHSRTERQDAGAKPPLDVFPQHRPRSGLLL